MRFGVLLAECVRRLAKAGDDKDGLVSIVTRRTPERMLASVILLPTTTWAVDSEGVPGQPEQPVPTPSQPAAGKKQER